MAPEETARVRDLSRAQWQRSVGAVICRDMGDKLLVPFEGLSTVEDIEEAAERVIRPGGQWKVAAYTLKECFAGNLSERREGLSPNADVVWDGLMENTHYHYPERIAEEAISTQVYFSLNLARVISERAVQEGLSGFETETLPQIAALLRRPDFRAMVDQSALTANGFWRDFSIQPRDIFYLGRPGDRFAADLAHGIRFTDDGRVYYGDEFRKLLAGPMRSNNMVGHGESVGVEDRPTSGCPARHLRPHFTDSETDQQALAQLALAYGMDAQDLLAGRPQSVIDDGLDAMATMLEIVAKQIRFTYSDSAQSPESTDQPLVGQA